MSRPPEALAALYHQRCNLEGADLESFLDEARETHAPEDVLALLDRIEEDVLENIGLMLQARPELEDVAEQRAVRERARLEALRQRVRTG